MRSMLKPFLTVFTIISFVIFGNQLVLVVKESLEKKGILITDLLPLIGFNMIRDTAIILSLSLFLAIILGINKAYKNSEAVVMNAIGLDDKHFIIFIQPIILFIFALILLLTTILVPWSQQQRNTIIDRSERVSEFSFINQNEFHEFKNGNIIFYASKVNQTEDIKKQHMQNIFIYTLDDNNHIITTAKQGWQYVDPVTNNMYLRLKQGVRYHGFPSDSNKKILNFDLYDIQIIDGETKKAISTNNKIELKSTLDLLSSNNLKEIAELQWRISQPLSVLVLSVLGVLLGKTSPRGGKNLGVLFGVIIFILYNNTLLIAKSSLEHGELIPIIGLWGVHLLILCLIFIFYAHRRHKLTRLFSLS